jgi:hypothetical protein
MVIASVSLWSVLFFDVFSLVRRLYIAQGNHEEQLMDLPAWQEPGNFNSTVFRFPLKHKSKTLVIKPKNGSNIRIIKTLYINKSSWYYIYMYIICMYVHVYIYVHIYILCHEAIREKNCSVAFRSGSKHARSRHWLPSAKCFVVPWAEASCCCYMLSG